MGVAEVSIVVSIILGIAALLGLTWWVSKRAQYRYNFLIMSRDGKNSRVLKARIQTNPENKGDRKFIFKNDNLNQLSIRDPNYFMDGKPYRMIIPDRTGIYQYIEDIEVNKDNFIKYSLAPEEREAAISGIQNLQRKYTPPDKVALGQMIVGIVMLVVVVIGVVYSVTSLAEHSDNVLAIAEENSKITSALSTSSTVNKQLITALLERNNDGDIVRAID